jgi:hypothetical protein
MMTGMRFNKGRKEFTLSWIVLLVLMHFLLVPKHSMEHTTRKTVESETKKRIKVIDAYTGSSIEGAFITLGDHVKRTDHNGMLSVITGVDKVAVRAHGYLRAEEMITIGPETKPERFSPKAIYSSLREKVGGKIEEPVIPSQEIKLEPFTPKALYLSFYGIGDKTLRESALNLIQETELNSLVIDVKGDRGLVPYKSTIPLVAEVGAQKIITVRDMGSLIRSMKDRGIYTIARIVVFKDNLLALKMPDLAVRTKSGEVWLDREGLAWADPFKPEVWDYNIAIALEAAQYGFDEIQFDYVRFPDALGPQFSMPNTKENRIEAISGFLLEARKRLLSYRVFLSADIFGYVCWNFNDTNIGQTLEGVAPHIDYLSPMLYPSGFQYGIPGYRIPVHNPYEVVFLTLKKAKERTGLSSVRFRPWLQAFRDYAFDKRSFKEREIREQISAVETFGSDGWMLWNPRNIYSGSGLKRDDPSRFVFQESVTRSSGMPQRQAHLRQGSDPIP